MNDTERLKAIFSGILPSFEEKFDAAGRGKGYKAHVGLSKDCMKEAIAEAAEKAQALLDEVRLHERKEIALDNYQGQTFSESTNWHGKFDKFVQNNERRISQLTPRKEQ